MNYTTVSTAAGGLALFLLAMLMMTEGLKSFGGSGLKRLLGRWTSSPARGVAAGMLVTALVQSSSAVTVATIGFVNAGVLTLRQALGVIFGTNVGTTITGWLVSLVGFGFKIESFALPLLALGVALRLTASGKRAQGLGDALAGFGLFFMGLALLKDAFAGLAASYGAGAAEGGLAASWPAALAVGFIATVLTQSSSAAIAIILSAAAGGMVELPAAAAAVIGANLGTTSTAALATLKATAAARRLALGHIAFNLVTGIVALALLPGMLWVVAQLADVLDIEGSPAAALALFHTVFNVLGVLLLLPFAGRLATALERLFRSAADDLARPQHLDATLATTPELAVAALREELLRLQSAVGTLVSTALQGAAPIAQQAESARRLAEAIAEFIGSLHTEKMPRDVADVLTATLGATRHLDEVARLAPAAQRLQRGLAKALPTALDALGPALAAAAASLAPGPVAAGTQAAALANFEDAYHASKTALMTATVARAITVDVADVLLDDFSSLRRMMQQWHDAAVSPALAAAPAAGDIDRERLA
jgi:phosphate:Na+ symporter